MTRADKRDTLLAALQEDPNRSDRAIAREVGVSHDDGRGVAEKTDQWSD